MDKTTSKGPPKSKILLQENPQQEGSESEIGSGKMKNVTVSGNAENEHPGTNTTKII